MADGYVLLEVNQKGEVRIKPGTNVEFIDFRLEQKDDLADSLRSELPAFLNDVLVMALFSYHSNSDKTNEGDLADFEEYVSLDSFSVLQTDYKLFYRKLVEEELNKDVGGFQSLEAMPDGTKGNYYKELVADWESFYSENFTSEESTPFLPIPAIIRQLREEYISNETVKNFKEINCGLCSDFADEVEYRFKTPLDIISNDHFVHEREGRDGWEGDELDRWNEETLSRYHSLPPEPFTVKDLTYAINGYHCWFCHEGKHYDAECPDGVENMFHLPFFKRQFREANVS